MDNPDMPIEAAEAFFAVLFQGAHHIPGKITRWGSGWCVNTHPSRFATYDFSDLSRLVFLAHDSCVRAEINCSGPRRIKICIWQRRKREGSMFERHPTLEKAVADWREIYARPSVLDSEQRTGK